MLVVREHNEIPYRLPASLDERAGVPHYNLPIRVSPINVIRILQSVDSKIAFDVQCRQISPPIGRARTPVRHDLKLQARVCRSEISHDWNGILRGGCVSEVATNEKSFELPYQRLRENVLDVRQR